LNGDDDYAPGSGAPWSVASMPGNEFDRLYDPVVSYNRADDRGAGDILYGGAGNDHLLGLMGDDMLYGEIGNDTAAGGGDDDFVLGGDGDDRLSGDFGQSTDSSGRPIVQGHDFIDGGAGNDFAQGEGGDDLLYGGAGDDDLWGDAKTYTDGALKGNDWLEGEDGNDNLVGQGGADTLYGGAGADSLFGDADDVAAADQGADSLDGGAGDDYLRGFAGDDTLSGGAETDQLFGDAGDDWLAGGDATDLLSAGDGHDVLIGNEGDDQLQGGIGNDVLDGGAGADYLDGGAGDDTYRIAAGETSSGLYRDTIYETSGADTLQLDGVSLSDLQVAYKAGGYVELTWGAQQSVLLDQGLTTSVRTVVAGNESTTLQKLVNERLTTQITAQSTRDGGTVLGGAGNDTIVVNHAGNRVAAGRGADVIDLRSTAGAVVVASAGQGMDQVLAVQRDGVASPGAQNVLELDAGVDGAALRLYQTGGNAFVLALNDQGDGLRFTAGDGGGAPIAAADWPFDAVRLADGSTLGWQQIVDRGILPSPAAATDGDDVRQLTPIGDVYDALAGNDSIDGLAGNDTLQGGDGNDTLIGGLGDDVLQEYQGANTLIGGEGNDTLIGGWQWAFDVSEGGEGNDSYMFSIGANKDISGTATDTSTTSNDTYIASGGGSIGGGQRQTWTLSDGGGNDTLRLSHSLVTPSNTTVRYTGTGLSLASWNVEVRIEGAITPDGAVDPNRSIETVHFYDGTTWSAAQMLAKTLQTTTGADVIHGYSGADSIDGGAGNDSLWGGAGNDTLQGGAGGDNLYGEAGNDVLSAGADGGMLLGGEGDDVYRVSSGDGQYVYLGAYQAVSSEDDGSDTLQLDVNADAVTISVEPHNFRPDEDYLVVRWNDGSATARMVLGGSAAAGLRGAVETIRFADGSVFSAAEFLGGLVPAPTAGHDTLTLKSSDDTVDGGAGRDTLSGRGGNDRLGGGSDDDRLYGGTGDDTLSGGTGNDFLDSGAGANTIEFALGDGQDTLLAANDGRSNTLIFGAGITPEAVVPKWQSGGGPGPQGWYGSLGLVIAGTPDAAIVGVQRDTAGFLANQSGADTVRFQDGTQRDISALVDAANLASSGADVLFDANGRNNLAGGDGNDTIYALDGVDRLMGEGGNDVLHDGTYDDDTLVGGQGEDSILGNGGLLTLEYARGDGNDTVSGAGQAVVRFTDAIAPADVAVEHRSFGALDLRVAGGGSVSIWTAARRGIDRVAFADGTSWSSDEVWARAFAGTAGDDHIAGLDGVGDTISGADGADTLEGGTGSDLLLGEAGDDLLDAVGYDAGFTVDADTLVGGAGNDTLRGGRGSVTYSFATGFGHDRIEWVANRNTNLLSRVVFSADVASSDVQVSRSPFGLVLSSISTGDTVQIDRFFVAIDSLQQQIGHPVDQVEFADGTVWTSDDLVARLTPAITAADDLIYGTDAAEVIDALTGDDRVFAGAGNDTLFGRVGDDNLQGGDGDDILAGGPGYDDLVGGAGNDRFDYAVGDGSDSFWGDDGAADTLVLGPGIAPADVRVSLGWLDASGQVYRLDMPGDSDGLVMVGVESVQFQDGTQWNLTQIDAMARTVYGTAGADTLTGTAGADVLMGLAGNDSLRGVDGDDVIDGGTGNDTMVGGVGNDTFVVDSAGDVVSESSGQGTDTVQSAVTLTLASNVENLVLVGGATINGTGNSLVNTLTGNSAANVLNGGTGADTLAGAAGDDTYVVDNAGDVVTELAGEGTDLVQSSVTYTLATEVENR
ncbi:MAG: hypothetical protein IT390_14320, partial [Nitrospira sp.]|nr:hypothetical protein [Nitrospira sp.]